MKPSAPRAVMALVRCPIVDYFTIVPAHPTRRYPGQLPGRATATLPSCTCVLPIYGVSQFRDRTPSDQHRGYNPVIDILARHVATRFSLLPVQRKWSRKDSLSLCLTQFLNTKRRAKTKSLYIYSRI